MYDSEIRPLFICIIASASSVFPTKATISGLDTLMGHCLSAVKLSLAHSNNLLLFLSFLLRVLLKTSV